MEFLCSAQIQAVEGVCTEPCGRGGSGSLSALWSWCCSSWGSRGGLETLATFPSSPWACWLGGGGSDGWMSACSPTWNSDGHHFVFCGSSCSHSWRTKRLQRREGVGIHRGAGEMRRGEDRALGGGPGPEPLEPKRGADPLGHPRSLGWGSGRHEPEVCSVVTCCGARSHVLPRGHRLV